VFGGDRLNLAVHAQLGARVHLTTQSATKLYRMEGAEEARQRLFMDVGPDAYVENVPDTLIPQAGSRYRQHTTVELAPNAMCLTAETLAPGRVAHGERFRYELVELRTSVCRDGRELCCETLRLEPRSADPARAGILSDGHYLVTLLALAPEHDADGLAAALDGALASLTPGVYCAAGALPNGAGARALALAPDAPSALLAVRTAWAAARRRLLSLPLPPARK
jgi:urease accessory protein